MNTITQKEHPFTIELWSGGDLDQASLLNLAKEQEKQERNDLCQSLGLEKQKGLIQSPSYQPFSVEDLDIWRRFLPVRFSKNNRPRRRLWAEYDFDYIPLTAMRAIARAQTSNCFSDLEIWVPAAERIDPLAVGLFGGFTYPIVRWGESLAPFEEIRETVYLSYLCLSDSNKKLLEGNRKLREKIIQFAYSNPGRSFYLYRGLPHIFRLFGFHRNHQYVKIEVWNPHERICLCECC